MAGFLRKNTASTIMIGEFVDDIDGKTAKGSLTLTPSVIFLSKNGGAYTQKNEGTNATSDPNLIGWYSCPLNATDTSASGILQLAVHVAGALPVWDSWMVVPANIYDSITGTDLLEVSGSSILMETVDSTYNFKQILQIMAAVMAGKVTGGNTSTITFRDLGDGTNRVVATVDSNGNRTDVVITP
jgi:hypothetical protein